MEYRKTVLLKDGRTCVLRNGTEQDGQELLDIFLSTHEQTDYLLAYPDETSYTAEQEAQFLKESSESETGIQLLAIVDGVVAGTAGIERVGNREKTAHRAEFGISIDEAFWGLGIGRAMTEACIECAKNAGYAQLELEVVAGNDAALALYESLGFVEYGRNPKGFRSRHTGWQELILMRLELDR